MGTNSVTPEVDDCTLGTQPRRHWVDTPLRPRQAEPFNHVRSTPSLTMSKHRRVTKGENRHEPRPQAAEITKGAEPLPALA